MEILRSPREIAEMRKAGLLVWEAHQLAQAKIRPGVTTAEIDAVIDSFFAKHKAVPLFKGVPGTVPFPATTCISINEEVVHGIPGPRELVEGDIVSIDTGCKLNGWCGDAAATYPVGRIAPDVRKLLDVARNVLSLAVTLLGRCADGARSPPKWRRTFDGTSSRWLRRLSGTASGATCTKTPKCRISSAASSAAAPATSA